MVRFEDPGTEAEALADQDDYGYEGRGRGRTKYTTCWYCKKPFPLREISRHARVAHNEESTKCTDCRKCGVKFPLREIRMHARTCSGPAPKPERIDLAKLVEDAEEDARKVGPLFGTFREGSGDSVLYEHDLSGTISDVFRKLREDEDRVITDAVILYLRSIGYTVEKPGVGNVQESAVSKFRAAWHAADREGRTGNRVRAGLEAARPLLNLEAVALIDKLRPAPRTYAGSLKIEAVMAVLDEIRDLIAPGIAKFQKAEKCRCKAHSEDRGGGYSELMLEPEPDCPEHGEEA